MSTKNKLEALVGWLQDFAQTAVDHPAVSIPLMALAIATVSATTALRTYRRTRSHNLVVEAADTARRRAEEGKDTSGAWMLLGPFETRIEFGAWKLKREVRYKVLMARGRLLNVGPGAAYSVAVFGAGNSWTAHRKIRRDERARLDFWGWMEGSNAAWMKIISDEWHPDIYDRRTDTAFKVDQAYLDFQLFGIYRYRTRWLKKLNPLPDPSQGLHWQIHGRQRHPVHAISRDEGGRLKHWTPDYLCSPPRRRLFTTAARWRRMRSRVFARLRALAVLGHLS